MKKNGAGYTIVELMIVITVTAVTAVAAFTIVGGQRSRAEFTQAVRDFELKLTDVANDVSKGYFPNVGQNQRCQAPANGALSFTSGAVEQGSSTDCVFAGKVIEFNPGGDDRTMNLITIAARRKTRDSKNVTGLSDLTDQDLAAVPGLDEGMPLLHGLRLRSIRFNGSAAVHSSVVFLSGFANQPSNTTNLTGSPTTDLYGLSNGGSCTSVATAIARPSCYQAPNQTLPSSSQGAALCMEFGTNGRRVLVTLGRDGRQLTTTTELDVSC